MSKTIVLVGPTMTADDVRTLLPGAVIMPPASAGDILRLACARTPPARIALIDGYFERMAAPWHKEIIYAMERGIAVLGAASMGALRAAELAPLGMIGVGEVFKAYLRGDIVDDAEVAVAHAPASHGYTAATVALVNVRFALARAVARRVLTVGQATVVLEAARGVFYRDRDIDAVLDAASRAGVAPRVTQALATTWARGVPDQKAVDARALLRRMARGPTPKPTAIVVERTWALGVFADQLGVTLRPAPRR